MLLKPLSFALALASSVFAQQNGTVPDLAGALNSSSQLSTLRSVIGANPDVLNSLSGLSNITLLAPSNAAFAKVDNQTLQGLTANQGLLTALLQYHVLNGTYQASAITNTSSFVPTALTNPLFTNVTGGQVVRAISKNGNVTFYSGLLSNSTVTQANINFTGGVIHVIDKLLVLPQTALDTLSAANLTSLRGAINATGLSNTINNTPNITIFAPSNSALQAVGSNLANLTQQQTIDLLTYHAVISSKPGYSSTLKNGTVLTAANGKNLTISIGSGGIFVNSARVLTSDVLIANGVVHVIDNVLNPNSTAAADSSASTGKPGFASASAASNVPFTSGQPTPSTTISPDATQAAAPTKSGAASSSSKAAAAPMQTGAVGMGALFGAAAVYFM